MLSLFAVVSSSYYIYLLYATQFVLVTEFVLPSSFLALSLFLYMPFNVDSAVCETDASLFGFLCKFRPSFTF